MQNSKANHFNDLFHKNKLNLFKTWESIRDIIEIYKNWVKCVTSVQIGNRTVKNSSEIASKFNNTSLPLPKEKLIKPKHKHSEYIKNPNANSFFISTTNNEKMLSVDKRTKK